MGVKYTIHPMGEHPYQEVAQQVEDEAIGVCVGAFLAEDARDAE